MSPRFVADDIDRVRERADVVEVISDHVRLKRAGRQWTGLCPFHQEKTPSLSVDRDKGVWYCHGCSTGGNVFTFLEKLDGLSFTEAVESLATRYGIELREQAGQKRAPSPRARIAALHTEAVELYRGLLASKQGEQVREYLTERGITPEACERHMVGFGGAARTTLVRAMKRKGFTNEEIVTSGLATRDSAGLRDMFFGRVVFPIFDPSGRPVAFGGRVLPEEYRPEGCPDGPKYMNSRETPLFRKSKILYGTNWARAVVHRSRRLVLVEGYTDVIALHEAGVGEAVATCGTSLTEDHMSEISSRFGDVKVILCLDADAAGLGAMSRERTEELARDYAPGERVAGGNWLPVGRGWLPEVYVASLPAGNDPADFVRAQGAGGIEKVLEDAVPLVRFLVGRAMHGADLKTPEGRTQAVRRGAAVLASVGDSFLRHEYTLWLADRVGVDSYEVAAVVQSRLPASKRTSSNKGTTTVPITGHHRVEREAVRALASMPEVYEDEALLPTEEDFTLPVHRSMYRLVVADRSEHGSVDIGRLSGRVTDETLRAGLSELAVGQPMEHEAAQEIFRRLKEFAFGRTIDEMKQRLKTLDPDRDPAAYDLLFEDLLKMEKQRRSLNGHSGSEDAK